MDMGHRVAIVGLGYVGLPLAVAFAEAGVQVVGLDVDRERVAMLAAGTSYIDDVSDERLQAVLRSGNFSATLDPACLEVATDIVICVPTPLTKHRIPDMEAVQGAARTVASRLRPGQLVVLESTTYPGTTDEVLQPALEEGGLRAGVDFALAYSPERIDPGATGSKGYTLRNTPKLAGGLTQTCTERALALYRLVVDTVVPVSSPRIAEMAKLFENVFRNVNMALVNELSMLCDRMDLDVWEVLAAAGTKPFGFARFDPSPGVGGHCIPVDPFYLTWKAREYGMHTRFIELAGEINENMPRYVVSRVTEALNTQMKSLNGSRILALGAAYKANVSDLRGSPALAVMEGLISGGARVRYHDPLVPRIKVAAETLASVPLCAEEVAQADCVVVLTDHAGMDYELIADRALLIVDMRNRVPRGKLTSQGQNVLV